MEWSDRHILISEKSAALFAEKGIAGTAVRDIAEKVGILSGSLYHYFDSKDAIADSIVTRYLDDLTGRYLKIADLPQQDRLSALVQESLLASEAHPHASEIFQNNTTYLKKLANYSKIREAAKTTRQVWMDVITDGIAAGQFRADLPPEFIYGLLRDAVWLSQRWFSPSGEHTREEFGEALISVFLHGIAPQAGDIA